MKQIFPIMLLLLSSCSIHKITQANWLKPTVQDAGCLTVHKVIDTVKCISELSINSKAKPIKSSTFKKNAQPFSYSFPKAVHSNAVLALLPFPKIKYSHTLSKTIRKTEWKNGGNTFLFLALIFGLLLLFLSGSEMINADFIRFGFAALAFGFLVAGLLLRCIKNNGEINFTALNISGTILIFLTLGYFLFSEIQIFLYTFEPYRTMENPVLNLKRNLKFYQIMLLISLAGDTGLLLLYYLIKILPVARIFSSLFFQASMVFMAGLLIALLIITFYRIYYQKRNSSNNPITPKF
jgi:hypothetical protein